MNILFGHPTGNQGAHQTALAYLSAGCLAAYCVSWMPAKGTLSFLKAMPGLAGWAGRLERRRFAPLAHAPTIQGRAGEWPRLLQRMLGKEDEGLAYQTNDWLMKTMAEACARPAVTAVHAYEDCSLLQFEAAKRRNKACIYTLPIGYYPVWQAQRTELARRYAEWLPEGDTGISPWERPQQKQRELELADLVFVASTFVRESLGDHAAARRVALTPYGIDPDFWRPVARRPAGGPLRFICAGHVSIRKGVPWLLDAWQKAGLKDAHLELVGPWQLAQARRLALPANVTHLPPCSREELRDRYQAADVLLFPSFFEGFGMVLLEAMACGLPAIATTATAGPDVLDDSCGRVVPPGETEQLVAALRWFAEHRDALPALGQAARAVAERNTWERYRQSVTAAVADLR